MNARFCGLFFYGIRDIPILRTDRNYIYDGNYSTWNNKDTSIHFKSLYTKVKWECKSKFFMYWKRVQMNSHLWFKWKYSKYPVTQSHQLHWFFTALLEWMLDAKFIFQYINVATSHTHIDYIALYFCIFFKHQRAYTNCASCKFTEYLLENR